MSATVVDAPDALPAMPGDAVALPYERQGVITAGECLEFRVLELGKDVRLRMEFPGGRQRIASDAEVSRHGLHDLVQCSDVEQAYSLSLQALVSGDSATARIAARSWGRADGAMLDILRAFSAASSLYADPNRASQAAMQLAESANRFEASGDIEHAAIASTLAVRRAEYALDRNMAAASFESAMKFLQALNWTRYRVVLLNNRALFMASENPREAQTLIDSSFALQAKLADPRLAAIIENNVCLVRYQYGQLNEAGPCFERVLAQHLALRNGPASVGAARNNIALVLLAEGRYTEAEAAFRAAAAERLAGEDKRGYVVSLGNVSLCLYQRGFPEAALQQLHEAYAVAVANGDELGKAGMAAYLAAIYLAWGDSDTASAFAGESERIYRSGNRIADLAPMLRLRARISMEQGDAEAALATIREAWDLAIRNDLLQAAANIASVHALILLDRGDLDAASQFIAEARRRIGSKFPTADLASLDTTELRWMRESGQLPAARKLAAKLLVRLANPGMLRTRVAIEKELADGGDARRKIDVARRSYQTLLESMRDSVASAPDPEMAYRMHELARPVAEAAIQRELSACDIPAKCASAALDRALEFFALEPEFDSKSVFGDTHDCREPDRLHCEARPKDGCGSGDEGELRGLLQALSQLQSRDDQSLASHQLGNQIKRLQSCLRLHDTPGTKSHCSFCDEARKGRIDLVYFFGATRSWRWQWSDGAWIVSSQPEWKTLRSILRSMQQPAARHVGLDSLSVLVAGLSPVDRSELVVGGDSRSQQIPWAALPLSESEDMLDRYVVHLQVGGRRDFAAGPLGTAAFVSGDGMGGGDLPMVQVERSTFDQWTVRQHLQRVDTGQGVSHLHIAAHGQRDVGQGTSVLWLKDHPVLSYLSPGHAVADTVVINSCDSGAISENGLAQASVAAAFLRAGARNVVATLFPVPDRVAAQFAETFYANYEPTKNNVAESVAVAQRKLRESRITDYAWVGFVSLTVSGRR